MSNNNSDDDDKDARFGKFLIPAASVFYRSPTDLSKAFVNLRPIVPGHVLVMSTRVVSHLADLTDEEYDDLWRTVRVVQGILKQQYETSTTTETAATTAVAQTPAPSSSLAFNVAVQDGRAAGQSVPHVHVHILPRSAGDFERNDDVYHELEVWAPRDACLNDNSNSNSTNNDDDTAAAAAMKLTVPEDDQRRDRTREEMAQEAAMYRDILAKKSKE
jgi:bis(5'-adenosyl)-triphosphatase